jgi:diguanylate cyclase (GGDEF)-like protein
VDEKEIRNLKKDMDSMLREVKDLKNQLREVKKMGIEFQDQYEEMLKKEEAFLGEINQEIEREITVVVLGSLKKTISKETAALKLLRRRVRGQVRNQITKEINREIQRLMPNINDQIKKEVKSVSVDIMSQLKRQTGKKLEQEVIEQVKETTNILREQKEESERRAIIDGLTGSFNRRFFETKLEDELNLSKRFRNKISLLMIDIDHFKKVNDTYGHQIGDVILQEVVEVTKSQLASTDSLCRYGGEEFAVIMPETELEKAAETAEKIRKAIEEHAFYGEDKLIGVTVSIGAAEYPENAIIKQALIEKADSSLYEAKHAGRNRVQAAKKDE